MTTHETTPSPRGYLMLTALVFGSIFLGVLASLSGFIVTQQHLSVKKQSVSEAFTIAEAGLEQYRWFLAHFPGDTQNGTGHAGPYSIPYNDPEGGQTGTISLSIAGNTSCGQTTSIDITSTGRPKDDPSVSKTVSARYALPSVASYSYILNDSVYAGPDRVISGPYHSNGGIRMDGTNNSPVTSSVANWLCTASFDCTPNATKPGVFGSGSGSALWSYPTPQVDFSAIAADFTSLKSIARTSGLYYTNGTPSSRTSGYHLIFNGNNTVTVKKVSAITNLTSVPIDGSSSTLANDTTLIKTETTLGTYPIPSSCGLIFVENQAWIEGTILGKVTVVVADVTSAQGTADAMLPGNITYATNDGTSGLTLIAQHDVLITSNSPQNMTLNGVFIAQSGAFGRNLYTCKNPTYDDRGTLSITGTTVSNKRTGTHWNYDNFDSCGTDRVSGYTNRTDSFDRRLASDPPAFTPTVSSDYQLLDWREQ